MYACDKQIKKLIERTEKVKVWCALESVDDKYLDFIAEECRALLYDTTLPADVKRGLITNSQYWHMKLGTSAALEEVINCVFPNTETVVLEWFEYGGRPFYFKIRTNTDMDKESQEEFHQMITNVKNVRSCLDGFEVRRDTLQELFSCGVCFMETQAEIGWETARYGEI